MTQVAVVGAGLIGRAWSIVFARAGFDESFQARAGKLFAFEYTITGTWGDPKVDKVLPPPTANPLEGDIQNR